MKRKMKEIDIERYKDEREDEIDYNADEQFDDDDEKAGEEEEFPQQVRKISC